MVQNRSLAASLRILPTGGCYSYSRVWKAFSFYGLQDRKSRGSFQRFESFKSEYFLGSPTMVGTNVFHKDFYFSATAPDYQLQLPINMKNLLVLVKMKMVLILEMVQIRSTLMYVVSKKIV